MQEAIAEAKLALHRASYIYKPYELTMLKRYKHRPAHLLLVVRQR
jgi:hypothetical protein